MGHIASHDLSPVQYQRRIQSFLKIDLFLSITALHWAGILQLANIILYIGSNLGNRIESTLLTCYIDQPIKQK